ncbi:MAG: MlaE family ABC transporter permease [Oligoflexales bacterium]
MQAGFISQIGRLMLGPITTIGSYSIFVGQGLKSIVVPMVDLRLVFQQLEFVGNKSFSIIILAGVMVGGIFGFQLGEIFKIFGAESMIGAAAGFALSRELAPMVGAFLVTGRAGSAMAAEIATMRVNEQIDAMRVMSVNPYEYLIAPRILASIVFMPVLDVFFIVAGVLSAFFIGVVFYHIDVADFLAKIQWIVATSDIVKGMQKSAVFGLLFSSIGCFQGYFATGGAKGVGKATTKAVVISYVCILVADYLISYLQFT